MIKYSLRLLKVIVTLICHSQMICAVMKAHNTVITDDYNDTRLNFTNLAAKYGYTAEQYEVITEDGYKLTLFRIPGRSQYPVLLVHGILDSADTWLLRGKNSLAITLADIGYDVWCANARGNRYSRRHLYLNPDEDSFFWNYSFHKLGYYDLPANIDLILKVTLARSLSAIGHSQGNTAFYVLGSMRPEYNNKVNVMMALAPVCYLHNSIPPLSTFIRKVSLIEKIFAVLNIHEVLGDGMKITQILRLVCRIPLIGYAVCILGLFFPLTGYDITELEPTFWKSAALYFPAGTSAMALTHYLQVGYRQVFANFDNGPNINQILYNSTTPPPYNLGKVTMPVALLAAKNDLLSTLPDVKLLKEQLPNVVFNLINPRLLFNHADDIWGRRMRIYLFPYIIKLLKTYNTLL